MALMSEKQSSITKLPFLKKTRNSQAAIPTVMSVSPSNPYNSISS